MAVKALTIDVLKITRKLLQNIIQRQKFEHPTTHPEASFWMSKKATLAIGAIPL